MYHGVGRVSEDPFHLFVSPERFSQQMNVLRVLGLRGVPFSVFVEAVQRGAADGLVSLTFDDGYKDVLTWAAPVLERHGFTATLFAVSGLPSGENVWDPPPRRSLMSEEDLVRLTAHGWEIGSHSVTHPHLTSLDADRLREEVSASGPTLAEVTGSKPRSFCYPYGSVNAEVVEAVRAAGYSYACAVQRVDGLPENWAVPRVGVTERDHPIRFAAKLALRGR
jgi:peptidoglycan/xylan/chitin deacetylase (PgdA/CDA1 family)